MRRIIAIFGVCICAVATATAASTYDYTATLKYNTLVTGRVVALSIAWDCSGKTCKTSGPWPVPGVAACAALAEKVGEVVAYGHPNSVLAPAQLSQCNAKAAKQPNAPSQIKPQIQAKPNLKFVPPKGPLSPGTSAQNQPSSKGKPAAPEQSDKNNAGAAVDGPVAIRTATLTVTGVDALATLPPFTAVSIRTSTLTVTGTGALASLAPFEPVDIRTEPLTVTGISGE